MKECRLCKIVKALTELKKDNRRRDDHTNLCKACHIIQAKEWQANNKERIREVRKERYHRKKVEISARRRLKHDYVKARWSGLKRLYKISEDWYNNKLQEQNFSCAICQKNKDLFTKPLVVDHDHKCCEKTPTCGNCNRGLLCGFCNFSLSAVEQTENWATKAEGYIKTYENS